MKISYDDNIHCKTYVCDICGYTYNYYYDYNKQIDNTEEPFILKELLLRKVHRYWEPNRIERLYKYACPKCGVLQVDIKSL